MSTRLSEGHKFQRGKGIGGYLSSIEARKEKLSVPIVQKKDKTSKKEMVQGGSKKISRSAGVGPNMVNLFYIRLISCGTMYEM